MFISLCYDDFFYNIPDSGASEYSISNNFNSSVGKNSTTNNSNSGVGKNS
jgi:hypothetical protein